MKKRDNWKWTRRLFKTLGGTLALTFGLGIWAFSDLVTDKTTLQDSYHFCKKHPVCYLLPTGMVGSSPLGSFCFWAGRRYNKES